MRRQVLAAFCSIITLIVYPACALSSHAVQAVDGIVRSGREVEVEKQVNDEEIARRIQDIVNATGWSDKFSVTSKKGIVFLTGAVQKTAQSYWIEELAKDTHGVVAVVNNLTSKSDFISVPSMTLQVNQWFRELVIALPKLISAVIVVLVFVTLTYLTVFAVRRRVRRRTNNPLVIRVLGNVAGFCVFVVGLYLALRNTGLTGVAFTVVGGTGAIGLLIGFALRRSLESYFSGVMLSLRGEFQIGDFVEVDGQSGVVENMTNAVTILCDVERKRIFIPNSKVYCSVISNLTRGDLTRLSLNMTVPLDVSIPMARSAIISAIRRITLHADVLATGFSPLGTNLAIGFSVSKHEDLAQRKSLVVEAVKSALEESHIPFSGLLNRIWI